jgi:Tol biopolymer transport system component
VIFDWYRDGLRLLVIDGKRDLFTLFALTGEKHKIATEVFNPSVSPNGSQIAFFRELEGHELRNWHELWIASTGGQEAKVQFTLDKNESFASNVA